MMIIIKKAIAWFEMLADLVIEACSIVVVACTVAVFSVEIIVAWHYVVEAIADTQCIVHFQVVPHHLVETIGMTGILANYEHLQI